MNLVRQYRLPLILVLPVGLALGACVGLALFVGSNDGTQTTGWLGYLTGLGAGVGVVTAGIAGLGAAAAVALLARRRVGDSAAPALGPIGIGAGVGVALVALTVGLAFMAAQNDWQDLPFWVIGAVIDTVLAVITAVVVTAATTRRSPARI